MNKEEVRMALESLTKDQIVEVILDLQRRLGEVQDSRARLRELLRCAERAMDRRAMRIEIEFSRAGGNIIVCGSDDDNEADIMRTLLEHAKDLGMRLPADGKIVETGSGDPK